MNLNATLDVIVDLPSSRLADHEREISRHDNVHGGIHVQVHVDVDVKERS
jgi:hypothetical protein